MARRRMLIYRDYREYSGGHGKFLDYVAHIDAHPDWQAEVYLTPESIRHDNPFAGLPNVVAEWRPEACDALLLGGMDWTAVPAPCCELDSRHPGEGRDPATPHGPEVESRHPGAGRDPATPHGPEVESRHPGAGRDPVTHVLHRSHWVPACAGMTSSWGPATSEHCAKPVGRSGNRLVDRSVDRSVDRPGNWPGHRPIINLLQHVRHADAESPLRAFLSRRAIRIGNSAQVTDAVRATGEVNGPLFTIASGLDLAKLAQVGARSVTTNVFVDGVKQRALGEAVAAALRARGLRVHLQVERIRLSEYLEAMAAATIAVPLPHPTEGLYLPGLNAMAMGRALVQPDCIGSREYAVDGANALVPARDAARIADAVCRLHGDDALRTQLVDAARSTATRFDLATERRQFHHLLDRIDELWSF